MKLESENVLEIELELTGYCNLKCPLCANQYSFTDHIKGKNIRKIDDWIRQLDKFKNLKSVYLAGILSEPTLYPYLFGLIDYLHSRCITIELYSNGNTHNQKWWNDLNKHVNEEDKVFFTICGSTQDIHSRYRVNSNLQQIIDNVMAFKQDNKNKNDWI